MILWMDSIEPGDEIISQHMVNMAMGVQVADKFQVVPRNKIFDLPLFFRCPAGSIYQDTFSGFIAQNIGVDHEGIENKFVDFYHRVTLFKGVAKV